MSLLEARLQVLPLFLPLHQLEALLRVLPLVCEGVSISDMHVVDTVRP